MPTDPLTPPGAAHDRPYYVEGKPLWLRPKFIGKGFSAYLFQQEGDESLYQKEPSEWYGPYSPSLLWQRPQLPAGTVALLLEAADLLQRACDDTHNYEWTVPPNHYISVAASLRAEAGKGEGT